MLDRRQSLDQVRRPGRQKPGSARLGRRTGQRLPPAAVGRGPEPDHGPAEGRHARRYCLGSRLQPQDAERQEGGSDRFWETQVGSPLAAEPLAWAEDGNLLAVTSHGTVFKISPAPFAKGVFNQPTALADYARDAAPSGTCWRSRRPAGSAAGKGSRSSALRSRTPRQGRPLSVPDGHKLACPPVAWRAACCWPTAPARCRWWIPRGDPLAARFQPPLLGRARSRLGDPGRRRGQAAGPVGRWQVEALLVGASGRARAELEILGEATVTTPIVSPLAVLGDTVYGGDAGKGCSPFTLPKLNIKGKERLLEAPAPGPRAGRRCRVVSTDDGQLLCFAAKGRLLWQNPLRYGPLAGLPLRVGGHYLLAANGPVASDAATGKELGKVETGYPLATGPVAWAGSCSSADMTEPSTKCDNHDRRE